MEYERDQSTQSEGKLTDELLEEKLHEGKGPLPFVPGADGDKAEPPIPAEVRDESPPIPVAVREESPPIPVAVREESTSHVR